jgi:hypothetical protein
MRLISCLKYCAIRTGRSAPNFTMESLSSATDADYEWQKNAAFDDELFNVPYAERNATDAVRDVDVERVQKQYSESEGSDRSTLTDVAQRKRSASEETATQRSGKVRRIARSQISCRVALDIAAEVDIVMGIVCHFFCDVRYVQGWSKLSRILRLGDVRVRLLLRERDGAVARKHRPSRGS